MEDVSGCGEWLELPPRRRPSCPYMGTTGGRGPQAAWAQLCHLGEVMTLFSILEFSPFIKSLPLTCHLLCSEPLCHRWASGKQDSFCLNEGMRVKGQRRSHFFVFRAYVLGTQRAGILDLGRGGDAPLFPRGCQKSMGFPATSSPGGCLRIFPHQLCLKLMKKTTVTTVIRCTAGQRTVLYEDRY